MQRLIVIASCLLPLFAYAGNAESDKTIASFQELCAKEKDPVERENYCYMLEQHNQARAIFNDRRKDTVIV